MSVTINSEQYYLWRAVAQEGNVLDILMQSRKDTKAAKKFCRQLLNKQGFAPRVIVTAQLKSYPKQHQLTAGEYPHQSRAHLVSGLELTCIIRTIFFIQAEKVLKLGQSPLS